MLVSYALVSATVRGSSHLVLDSGLRLTLSVQLWVDRALGAPPSCSIIGEEVARRQCLSGDLVSHWAAGLRGGPQAGPAGRRAGLLGPSPEPRAVALFSSADLRRE